MRGCARRSGGCARIRDTIEYVARKDLGLARRGEILVVLKELGTGASADTPAEAPDDRVPAAGGLNGRRYLCVPHQPQFPPHFFLD